MPDRTHRRPRARSRGATVFGLTALFGGGMAAAGPGAFAATPTITTSASGGAVVGGAVTDVATLSGLVDPDGTGTLTFSLYGPGNDCSGTAAFTSQKLVDVIFTGALPPVTVTSAAYTTTAAGTYRWIASYSGDANNGAVSTACNDANETTVVSPATPTLTTTAAPGAALGAGTLTDTVTVANRVNPSAGSVTFTLYGPDDANCTGPVVFTSPNVALAATPSATATSTAFTPTRAGTYRWVAAFNGDANNAAVPGSCNGTGESATVARTTPTITTTAGADLAKGALVDTASLAGLINPTATGTVTFSAYGPADASCTGTPAFTSTRPLPAGSPSVSSAGFSPTQTGTYRWVATYSGDANNGAVTGACTDPGETTVVSALPSHERRDRTPRPDDDGTDDGVDDGVDDGINDGIGDVTCFGLRATFVRTDGGNHHIIGTSARDVIVTGSGDDIIEGRGGNDVICAGGGDDAVDGGSGRDVITGGAGQDTLYGGTGRDVLLGGDDDDAIYGAQDDDILLGQAGEDRLVGGTGEDDCRGGADADVFNGCEHRS